MTAADRAAGRTKGTYLAAHQAQIKARRGYPKAIGATRHDILVAFFYIVRDRGPFKELGPDGTNSATQPNNRTPTAGRTA